MLRVPLCRVLVLATLWAGWGAGRSVAAPPEEGGAGKAGAVMSSQPADAGLLLEFKMDYNKTEGSKRAVFDKYIEALGAMAMLDALEEALPRCHSQAHDLGAVVYTSTGDMALSLEICGSRYTGACMHGVVREAYGDKPLEEVQAAVATFCEGKPMSGLHSKGNCAHAMGQALMAASGHDLEKSLAACATHPDKAMGYYCATGAYFEYFTEPDDLDLAVLLDLHAPCGKSAPYPAACYRYKSNLMLRGLKGDAEALKKECMEVSGPYRGGCFHGVGIALLPVVFDEPSKLKGLCDQGTVVDRILCVEGVVEKLADYDEDRARQACGSLDDSLADVCFGAAKGKMYRLDKSTLPLYTGE